LIEACAKPAPAHSTTIRQAIGNKAGNAAIQPYLFESTHVCHSANPNYYPFTPPAKKRLSKIKIVEEYIPD